MILGPSHVHTPLDFATKGISNKRSHHCLSILVQHRKVRPRMAAGDTPKPLELHIGLYMIIQYRTVMAQRR